MTTTRIGKRFRFEAAHHLPHHDGKCRNPHGHSYEVEVTFAGEPEQDGPKRGMVVDFGDVSAVWKTSLFPELDHRDLNESLNISATTAEFIAAWIYARFRYVLGEKVERVRVWETESSFAEFPA